MRKVLGKISPYTAYRWCSALMWLLMGVATVAELLLFFFYLHSSVKITLLIMFFHASTFFLNFWLMLKDPVGCSSTKGSNMAIFPFILALTPLITLAIMADHYIYLYCAEIFSENTKKERKRDNILIMGRW